MLRCSFGSREIKCIHLHLLAGVGCVTCRNRNALFPPETRTTGSTPRHTTRSVSPRLSRSRSLSLFHVSPRAVWFCILLSSTSLLSHLYKCLPLLLQSGSVSLWHLTNSITNNPIRPLHFEWWHSRQWLLLIEQLSDRHTWVRVLHPHTYMALSPVSNAEPLLTPD